MIAWSHPACKITYCAFVLSDFKKAQDARDMQALSLKDIQERCIHTYMYLSSET